MIDIVYRENMHISCLEVFRNFSSCIYGYRIIKFCNYSHVTDFQLCFPPSLSFETLKCIVVLGGANPNYSNSFEISTRINNDNKNDFGGPIAQLGGAFD